MSSAFHIIIPARYNSTRFPGKLLKEIHGMTVIERVYRQALQAEAQSVLIATDSDLIAKHAQDFGAEVVMTSSEHPSGTDRVAEAVAKQGFASDEIIVNVQGDEPFISPQLIQQVSNSLLNTDAPMATLCWPIENLEQWHNPNVVKVVRSEDEHALYFSRSPIPNNRDQEQNYSHALKHIGIYAFRAKFLQEYVQWPMGKLEGIEKLEHLRILEKGYKIKVEQACVKPMQDINTKEDLEAALST